MKKFEDNLLTWYDLHQRTLPWRALPGHRPNPYHVWLSEIMLQQTTVATVKDYFTNFITRWPTVESLAQASLDDIFHVWQGLGYYSRARNLHKCAQMIVQDFLGLLPHNEEILLTMPGIGSYTAAAVAAIAFDQPTVPMDGNIVRVISRLNALLTPLPIVKQEVQNRIKDMIPSKRSGDFAQALMDLGATICRPRNPQCQVCPLNDLCKGFALGIAAQLPTSVPKAPKPHRYGIAFWIENKKGEILIEKRPDKGLLAGLMGFPTTDWRETPWEEVEESKQFPLQVINSWTLFPKSIHHTFTHFHLELKVAKGRTSKPVGGIWSSLENLKLLAFPTVMKKVIHVMRQVSDLDLPK